MGEAESLLLEDAEIVAEQERAEKEAGLLDPFLEQVSDAGSDNGSDAGSLAELQVELDASLNWKGKTECKSFCC